MIAGGVAELLRAGAVELQFDHRLIAHGIAARVGAFDKFPRQAISQFLLNHKGLQRDRAVGRLAFHLQHFVARLDDALLEQLIALRMDHSEFKVGRLLDVGLGLILRCLREARQLDQNVVGAGRLDDRLGHAQIVHPTPQHLRRLRHQPRPLRVRHRSGRVAVGIDRHQVVGVQAHQELRPALKVESQLDLP